MLSRMRLINTLLTCIGLVSCTQVMATAFISPVYGPPTPIRYYDYPAIPKQPQTPVIASRGDLQTNDDKAGLWVITEYTAGAESTGKNPGDPGYGIAANGQPIQKGEVACDPKYPFGTRFYIDGIGTVSCSDRGNAINGNHLDVYTDSLHDALQFGKQIRMVRVLGK